MYCTVFYSCFSYFFFFNDTATTEIYTLSLHDALPILRLPGPPSDRAPRRRRDATTRLPPQRLLVGARRHARRGPVLRRRAQRPVAHLLRADPAGLCLARSVGRPDPRGVPRRDRKSVV